MLFCFVFGQKMVWPRDIEDASLCWGNYSKSASGFQLPTTGERTLRQAVEDEKQKVVDEVMKEVNEVSKVVEAATEVEAEVGTLACAENPKENIKSWYSEQKN